MLLDSDLPENIDDDSLISDDDSEEEVNISNDDSREKNRAILFQKLEIILKLSKIHNHY